MMCSEFNKYVKIKAFLKSECTQEIASNIYGNHKIMKREKSCIFHMKTKRLYEYNTEW
jgi:hypothetical protein